MFKKFKLPLFGIAFAIFLGLFVSCTPQAQSASIIGNWKSEWDGYVITEKEITYDDGGYGFGWSGKIEEIKEPYIYVSFEQDGKTLYRVTAFQNVTDVSANIADAYKDGKLTCETLEEAKTEFTIDNGYFGYFGEYVRQ
jgi:hypothetical protein